MAEFAYVCTGCGAFCHENGWPIEAHEGLASKALFLPQRSMVCKPCHANIKPVVQAEFGDKQLPPTDR